MTQASLEPGGEIASSPWQRPTPSASTTAPTRCGRSSWTARTDGRSARAVFDYPSGEQGVLLDPKDPHLARQNPADYVLGLERVGDGGARRGRDGARVLARRP